MAQPSTVSDTLRKHIAESGLSLVRLGQLSGVDDGRLSRFMRRERGLTVDAVDRLCKVLGLRLVPERKGAGTRPTRRKVKR